MADRSTNTMQEALQKLMKQISEMKTLPDADMPFLIQLETLVLNRMKQPAQQQLAAGGAPMTPAPMHGGMPPGMSAPQGMGLAAGTPMGGGMSAGAQAPGGDELARLLGAGAPGLSG